MFPAPEATSSSGAFFCTDLKKCDIHPQYWRYLMSTGSDNFEKNLKIVLDGRAKGKTYLTIAKEQSKGDTWGYSVRAQAIKIGRWPDDLISRKKAKPKATFIEIPPDNAINPDKLRIISKMLEYLTNEK